jgi:hypothetical protein
LRGAVEPLFQVNAQLSHRLQVEVTVVNVDSLVAEMLEQIFGRPVLVETPVAQGIRDHHGSIRLHVVALEPLARERAQSLDLHCAPEHPSRQCHF